MVFEEPDNEWRITLGYDSYRIKTTETTPNPYAAISAFTPANIEKETLRKYKTFCIDAKDDALRVC